MILMKVQMSQKKSVVLILLKQKHFLLNQKHYIFKSKTLQWSWKLYVNKTEICLFERTDDVPPYSFCLGSVPKNFTTDEMKEIALNGNWLWFNW